jgi:hypothetical protein
MKYYAGRSVDDPPLGGGEFPATEGYCGEECNFVSGDDGYVYGYFETIKGKLDRQVRIENLGVGVKDNFIDGVDIVWTAPEEGNGPRVVVGWYRNARLYRFRQRFNSDEPSAKHVENDITSFRVRTRFDNAFLLHPEKRTMRLGRGKGWSGQASWWYAEDTRNKDARKFVGKVMELINGRSLSVVQVSGPRPKDGRAGAAASEAYQRYIREYEIAIHPEHDKLHKRFVKFLRQRDPNVRFPPCFRDDLRYALGGEQEVMVEIKPADTSTVRFAIRAAIGQLLDYRQHQQWMNHQMIVVGAAVTRSDDLSLALDNGFGLAWPVGTHSFELHWPGKKGAL